MTTVLQALDTDETTVLFDLNDPTGANNPNGTKTFYGVGGTFPLGVADTEVTQFAPDSAPGGFTVHVRDPLKQSSWINRFVPLSYDALVADAGYLANLLAQGCPLKWIPDGSALTKLIDVEPSPAPALFRGQEYELVNVLRNLDTPDGLQFQVWRQPGLRGTTLDAAANLAGNDSMLIDVGGTGRPDGFSWSLTTNITAESIDAAKEAYAFTIATTGSRTLSDAIISGISPGDVLSAQMEMFAGDGVTARAALQVTFYQSDGTTVTGSATATAQILNPTPRRFTLTTGAAPALTAKAKIQVVFTNTAATAVGVWLRRAMLEKSATVSLYRPSITTMTNDPAVVGGLWVPVYVQGDLPTPVTFQVKFPDSDSKVDQLTVAAKASYGVIGRNRLAPLFAKAAVVQGESGTLGADTTDQSGDTSASGGHAAKCTFATVTTMARRTRNIISTNLATLRGAWDVYARIRNSAVGKTGIQLRWGPSSEDPSPYPLAEVFHDTTLVTTFDYVFKNMGRINVPPSATLMGSLTLEMWAERLAGSPELRIDFLVLVPADDPYGLITVPDAGAESWTGDQFLTITNPAATYSAPDVTSKAGEFILSALNQGAGSPPAAGLVWGAARHVIIADLSLQQNQRDGVKIGEMRVRNVTDSADVAAVDLTPSKKSTWTVVAPQIAFDGVAGKAYEVQFIYTAATRGGQKIWGRSAVHQTQNYAGQNQNLQSVPWPPSVTLIDNSKQILQAALVSGVTPAWLRPGLNALYAEVDDIPNLGYAEDRSVLGRTWSIEPIYAPRWRY